MTTAIRLIEQGWDVHLVAREIGGSHGVAAAGSFQQQTTSNGAGALWEFPPFEVEPQVQAREWALQTREVLRVLASSACTGVYQKSWITVARSEDPNGIDAITGFSSWSCVTPGFTAGKAADLFSGGPATSTPADRVAERVGCADRAVCPRTIRATQLPCCRPH